MARKVEAIATPALLVWARESSRLDLNFAAKRLNVTPERLQQWENGEKRPTIGQLRKMATLYKRPLAVFYLPEPPKTFDVMHDFRRLQDGERIKISPELNQEIRRAWERREVAVELAESLENNTGPALHVERSDNPDQVAERVREYLGVVLQDQFHWSNKYEALNAWKSAIEGKGILVFQAEKVPLEEMRGMSISERIFPVIVLNGQDSPRGRIFTLIHELVHILLKDGGICDLHEFGKTEDVEAFCNYISGAVLVPAPALRKEPLVLEHERHQYWSDDEISALADKYWVSQEVLLRRLVLIGVAPEDFYRKKREEFLAAYADQREKDKQRLKEVGGHPPVSRIAIRNNGLLYTKLVLDAYHDDNITASDVSDFLGVRLKHLDAIEHAVLSSGTEAVWQ